MRARARVRVRVCVCACMFVCVCVCVYMCVRMLVQVGSWNCQGSFATESCKNKSLLYKKSSTKFDTKVGPCVHKDQAIQEALYFFVKKKIQHLVGNPIQDFLLGKN